MARIETNTVSLKRMIRKKKEFFFCLNCKESMTTLKHTLKYEQSFVALLCSVFLRQRALKIISVIEFIVCNLEHFRKGPKSARKSYLQELCRERMDNEYTQTHT